MTEFDGPHFEPGLIGPDGRLTRFCKGADNSAATKEMERGRKQQARQFAETMRTSEQQLKASQSIQIPEAKPASPVPSMGIDTKSAGRDFRRNARRRFKTVYAGSGGAPAPSLGGAVALAA